ncbi:CoA transferase [Rhodococcus sp. T7]|uniref:CoA transferase n=1 Tax=Rhodococcus sp. T7 TaxID=627444 RepID=UPI00135CBC48|nr:CoA transferase [Rhodococcus sp. T7]KAF0957775.1 Succinyl-CoA:(R)-benzylsuccinate CoA-transferase subunit BbsE [Rhodococcus sp. T7]KAF0959941.1 Succinyl-CoA:(R)-benzylsuccinate CoA-transferase subunit BbsE [Rhodococcus sp. T7]
MYDSMAGITVIELAGSQAAAFAGKLLADVGATVVRFGISDPDPYLDARKLVSTSPVTDLLAGAEVLLTDLDDEGLTNHGVTLDGLRHDHPALVVTALSPLGRTGHRASWNADEIAMQAMSGLMHVTGYPDREPLAAPYGLGALQLGISGAGATCAAVFRARRSGIGAMVEISGAEVLASYVRIYGAVGEYYGIELNRAGHRAPGSGGRYPFGIFPCKDGHVALIARTAAEWDRFVAMMGSPEWASLPRYTDARAMAMDYPDEVDGLVVPWLQRHTRNELLELAQQHKVPMAPVRRVDELTDDIQMQYRNFFETTTLADGTPATVPGRPWVESM